MKFWTYLLASVLVLAVPATVAGDSEWYLSGSLSSFSQGDSSNRGAFTSDFTTGDGSPAVPNGTVLPAGTSVGWETEFDSGIAFSFEGGKRYGNGWRSGLELSRTEADVDFHAGVTAGGGLIDGVDAAVLTGDAMQLGVTVADVVGDGRGDISNLSLLVNAYYDFNRDGKFSPYIGAGFGLTDVDVTFNPSGVGIVDDGSTELAYQLKLGGTLNFNAKWEGFAEYTLRTSPDVEVSVDLIPANLDIENDQDLFSIGARYRFGN